MDPRLWENGQRLDEMQCDPHGNASKFTEAAMKAQDAVRTFYLTSARVH